MTDGGEREVCEGMGSQHPITIITYRCALVQGTVPDLPQACGDHTLLASADPCYWIRLLPGRSHTLQHVGTSGYYLSADQAGNLIRTYLRCSLTYDLSTQRCSDWSPPTLWHTLSAFASRGFKANQTATPTIRPS